VSHGRKPSSTHVAQVPGTGVVQRWFIVQECIPTPICLRRLTLSLGFGFESTQAGNQDGPSCQLDDPLVVKRAQIARDDFTYSPNPRGDFPVAGRNRERDAAGRALAAASRHLQQESRCALPHSGER